MIEKSLVIVPEKLGHRRTCRAVQPTDRGYSCTRPRGHRGRHACYWLYADPVGEVLAVWP